MAQQESLCEKGVTQIDPEFFCEFKKRWEKEPTAPYAILCYSLFYNPNYLRHYHGRPTVNIAKKRQLRFLYALTTNIENADMGFIPAHWKFRIFYDDSLLKFEHKGKKPWQLFFQKYKRHPKVQLVKYDCPGFRTETGFHIGLFGTIMRLKPLFEKDPLVKMIVLCDADEVITRTYLDNIKGFEASDAGFNSICTPYSVNAYMREKKYDCYLHVGMLASKTKFDPEMWDFIMFQLKNCQHKSFSQLLKRLQERWQELNPDKPIRSYRDFEYGMDEIIVNYYITKLLKKQNVKMRRVWYRPLVNPFFRTLSMYLDYNYREKPETRKDIDRLLQDFLGKRYRKGKFKRNNKMMTDIVMREVPFHCTFDQAKPYIMKIRKNIDILERLGVFPRVIDYFRNVSAKDFEHPHFTDYFMGKSLDPYMCPQ